MVIPQQSASRPVLLPPAALFGEPEKPAQPALSFPKTSPAQSPARPALNTQDSSQLKPLPEGKSPATVSLISKPSGKELAAGVWYDTSKRTAEGGVVRVLTLDPAQAELVPVFEPKGSISAKQLAQKPGLIAAINASFFGKFIIGDIKANQQIIRDDSMPYIDKISDQRYFIGVTQEGQIKTGKGGLSENAGINFKHFVGGFPALYTREQLKNLEQDIRSGTFDQRASYGGDVKHDSISRSFMGVTADGKVLLVAAGIGNQRSKGVTMAQGARLLRELGAVEAYILDGGGSTTVFAKGVEHARTDGRQVWTYLGIQSKSASR